MVEDLKKTDLQKEVSDYYGKELGCTADLKTSACCSGEQDYSSVEHDALLKLHDEIVFKFYGCGSPIPHAIEGATLIDLGCGTGRDSYISAW